MELTDKERHVYVAPPEFAIFEAALEALQEQERQHIAHIREGIAAASGEPGKATVPADSWFIDTAHPNVTRGEAGAYVKAWVFVEYPTCDAPLGIHGCVRPLDHEGPHACDSECDLGHLREDELVEDTRS